MRWIVAVLLTGHGLIHLMGFAKAFGYANVPQLTQPISRPIGLMWLAAAFLVVASAVMLVACPRRSWIVGVLALVISQAVILSAWRDAWAGTVVNLVLLLAVAHGWLTEGPWSFGAQLERDVAVGLARPLEAPVVTEADLERLPEPVRRYLRATGVLGQPRVRNYRLRFRGRIRSAPGARWMPFVLRSSPALRRARRSVGGTPRQARTVIGVEVGEQAIIAEQQRRGNAVPAVGEPRSQRSCT
jgi:hypothetical protein